MPDVRLTAASAPTRRALTPSAWLVLEELALTADRSGVASTNARDLAAALGMSKDTAARALRRLIVCAFVERVEHRSLETGQFAPVAYRVDLAAVGLEVEAARAPDEPSTESTGDERRATTARVATHQIDPTPTDGNQLELFRGLPMQRLIEDTTRQGDTLALGVPGSVGRPGCVPGSVPC